MTLSDDLLTMLVTVALLCGLLSGFIALSKDRNWLVFAMIGMVLGPLGLIVTGFAEPAAPTIRTAREDPERHEAPPPEWEGERPA